MNEDKLCRITKSEHKRVDWDMKNVVKACRPGCSACCHQSVSVFAPEGLVLERYISAAMSPAQRTEAKEKGEAWLKYFNQITRESSLNNPLTEVEFAEAERRIKDARVPCLFLENDKCMVYDARPLVCRTYAVESSPEECETNPHRNVSEQSTRMLVRHFRNFMKIEPVVLYRPLVYAVSEALGITTYRKPVMMPVRSLL